MYNLEMLYYFIGLLFMYNLEILYYFIGLLFMYIWPKAY